MTLNNSKLTHKSALIIILTTSLIARIGAAIYMGNEVEELPGIHDQLSYHYLSMRVFHGNGFSFGRQWWPITAANAPTAHWSFLYTYFLTAVYKLFGITPIIARLIQVFIVSIVHPLLVYLIGKKIWSPTVGLFAAASTSVYIYFIYYSASLMTESFYITAILFALYLMIRIADKATPSYQLILLFGITLGIIILLRQLFLLVVPFLFVWLWWSRWRKQGLQSTITQAGIATAIIILMIAPFTLYNYSRFNSFVLLNTNAGYAFFWGNHPIYGTQFEPILPPEMGTYGELIPIELHSLNEAELERELLQRGIQFILDDPVRYIQLSISRIPPYFKFWPEENTSLIGNISRVGSFGIFLPFMLWGLIGAFPWHAVKKRDRQMEAKLLLLGFALLYTTIHVMTWTLIRYRLPVDSILLLFAAVPLAKVGLWLSATILKFRNGSMAGKVNVVRML